MPDAVLAESVKSVAGDDEVGRRIRRLVLRALDQAEQDLLSAAPARRDALIKTMLPLLVKQLDKAEERDDALEEMRAEMSKFRAALRGQVGTGGPRDTDGVDSESGPAVDAPIPMKRRGKP